jgi:hypothetical protein
MEMPVRVLKAFIRIAYNHFYQENLDEEKHQGEKPKPMMKRRTRKRTGRTRMRERVRKGRTMFRKRRNAMLTRTRRTRWSTRMKKKLRNIIQVPQHLTHIF